MIENLLYTAVATLVVIIVLHIGVFWVSRVIQPPKPRVVYMSPPPPIQQQQYNTLPHTHAAAPIAPIPAPMPPAPEIKLPTYDTPPVNTKQSSPPPPSSALPPPIETRDPARS